ncbi:MAG: hypothetical protein FWD11_04400, partial [Micrococcales bacterium]|nr:hypothetical protein [Micrococcales bacterium]
MSVQVADAAPVAAVRRFVDGTLVSGLFEQLLRTDTAVRAYLSSVKAPGVAGHLLGYLRGLDWLQPKEVLEAQRALVRLLVGLGEQVAPTDFYERRARLFDQQLSLWSRVQPSWVHISPTYFSTLLEEFEPMAEESLEQAMKAKVQTLFRFRSQPPSWLHEENWPVNANGPLTFVEQVDISGPYDTSYRFVFWDDKSQERHELVQSTARFDPKSPLPASTAVEIKAALDYALVPATADADSLTVPMPVLMALAEALENLDEGYDEDGLSPDPVAVEPTPANPFAPSALVTPTRPTMPQESAPVYQPTVDAGSGDEDLSAPGFVPTRWGVEVDEGRQIELWSSSVVVGRSPQASSPDVQRLTVTWDPSLLDTHARLDLTYGSWWVTNFGVDAGVTVIGARGGRVLVPAGRSAPVRTHLWLGSVAIQLVPLPDDPAVQPSGPVQPSKPVQPSELVQPAGDEPNAAAQALVRTTPGRLVRRQAVAPQAAAPGAVPAPDLVAPPQAEPMVAPGPPTVSLLAVAPPALVEPPPTAAPVPAPAGSVPDAPQPTVPIARTVPILFPAAQASGPWAPPAEPETEEEPESSADDDPGMCEPGFDPWTL